MLPKKIKFPKLKSLFTIESILFSKRIRKFCGVQVSLALAKAVFFVPNPSTMVHRELAFLVIFTGIFTCDSSYFQKRPKNFPYRMIISNISRYSISDYITASESRRPFVPQSVSILSDLSLKPVRFHESQTRRALKLHILLDSQPSKKGLNVLLRENPKTTSVKFVFRVTFLICSFCTRC